MSIAVVTNYPSYSDILVHAFLGILKQENDINEQWS